MSQQENIISVSEAVDFIQQNTTNFGEEKILFTNSIGRVLAEDILADRDFPAYDNVRMDGIAVNFNAIKNGQSEFNIQDIQAAGSTAKTLESENNCIEVMTGSILPKNTDLIIQYEWMDIIDGKAHLNYEVFDKEQLASFKNIQAKGSDKKKGEVLISKNTKISSAEIAIIATVGKFEISVKALPRVLIVSTGDELVEVDETPKEYQIRRSNVFALKAILKENRLDAEIDHITDDKQILEEKISAHLNTYDVLLFSGAVSKGKFDFLPEILDKLGVKKLFHKVKQRPGKPFWFGKKADKTVFAFPGNPVSTYVGCLKYFLPWLDKCLDIETTKLSAILTEDFNFKPSLYYFLSVQVNFKEGKILAKPIKGKGSGDLANLAHVDGFLELSAHRTEFKKGEKFPLILFRKFTL